jgi:hypothetical protein
MCTPVPVPPSDGDVYKYMPHRISCIVIYVLKK